MLGKLLDGRYKVIQILSSGGFGETYIAEDTRRPGNPQCVLKQLKPVNKDPFNLQVARRLFNTEAEILEQLGNHDQIPRLLAYFEEEEEFYLVQELIVGHSLSREMRSGETWTESQVISMLQDVLGVLDFVHSRQVVHRDIKPDNLIRRGEDGKLVLIDFGAVKQIQTQMAANESQVAPITISIGTPGYIPAEQSKGYPRPSSDIYAVGIIGISAVTGLYPSQLHEHPETGELVWENQAQISPGLAAILRKMVYSHWRDRYQSTTAILHDLQQLDNHQSSPLTPLSPAATYLQLPAELPAAPTDYSQSPPLPIPVPAPPLIWLYKTLAIVKFLPFVGVVGLFLFKSIIWMFLLGISLISFGIGIFWLRSWYPSLARNYDAIFAIILCICGILVFLQEYRAYGSQELPISQFMLAGAAIYSLIESIELRGKEGTSTSSLTKRQE